MRSVRCDDSVTPSYRRCVELRYTLHARRRMTLDEISEQQVEAVLEGEHDVFEQQDTIRYHGVVDGIPLGVVVKRRTFPPRIVTAFRLWPDA